jgi:hypothetical protein
MAELKPCKCGCTDILISEGHEKGLHTYAFDCKNIDCGLYPIVVFSHSKVLGYKRAVKAWNRRAEE